MKKVWLSFSGINQVCSMGHFVLVTTNSNFDHPVKHIKDFDNCQKFYMNHCLYQYFKCSCGWKRVSISGFLKHSFLPACIRIVDLHSRIIACTLPVSSFQPCPNVDSLGLWVQCGLIALQVDKMGMVRNNFSFLPLYWRLVVLLSLETYWWAELHGGSRNQLSWVRKGLARGEWCKEDKC